MRKYFHDIEQTVQDEIYEIYRARFEGITDDNFRDIYVRIKPLIPFEIGESTVRCNMKSRYQYEQKKLTEDDTLTVYKNKLDYEKHKLQRERLMFNKEKRDTFDFQLLEETFIKNFELTKISPNKEKTVEKTNSTVYLSDLHIGKYTKEEHLDILNFVHIECTKNLEKYTSVSIVIAGDVVDGLLRISQLKKLKSNLSEQVIIACDLLNNFIEQMNKSFNVIEVKYIDEDNHGEIRPLGSTRNDFPEENFNKIISHFLKSYCNHNNINFISGETFKHNGYDVYHGHQFRNIKAVRNITNKSIIGHYHHYENIEGKHILLPGLVYDDDYTKSLGIADSKPGFMIETNDSWKLIEKENNEK